MQRGRFAQEFLAELMREPRAMRVAMLAERARWLRSLKINGREDLLFELELHLRGIELAFNRRHLAADGRALLGQDFAEEVRAVRDALHRASMLARRLTLPATEQSIQFRAYIERHSTEEARRSRITQELHEQRTPEESLYVLRHHLRALQGMADQLLRQTYVTFQAFDDFAVLGEHVILSSKYFRPPSALEFRTEYDRVGSVRLLELVKRVSEARARKALALGFLASFRLLRYLRFIPAAPVAAPRRALLTAHLVHDESIAVANYLTVDLTRFAVAAKEHELIVAAATDAAEHLRNAAAQVAATLSVRPVERAALDAAREALSEGAKAAASALAQAVEPGSNAAEIFDGQRARRERAERLRRDLWLSGELLKGALEQLFPAMKGEQTKAFEEISALVRFFRDFRQVGYYLLRSGDHDPFDRFFQALDALTTAAQSPARDRHLYLECRRFLTVVERSYALVCRRAELLSSGLDLDAARKDLIHYRAGTEPETPADTSLVQQLLLSDAVNAATGTAAPQDAMLEMLGEPPEEDGESDVDFSEEADLDLIPVSEAAMNAPAPAAPTPAAFDPELTRRIWKADETG
jgi:hypothetical protein